MPGANPVWSTTFWGQILAWVLMFLPRLGTAVVIFLAFCIAGLVVQRLVMRLWKGGRIDSDLTLLLGRVVKITLIAIGAVTALGTVGVDVTALVAGLGLTGFALGFALKDIISNALAGILVIIYEPFKRNDHITVTGLNGTVEEINLRYTILDSDDKRTFIPNSNLFTNPVIVHKKTPQKPAPTSADVAPTSAKDKIVDYGKTWQEVPEHPEDSARGESEER